MESTTSTITFGAVSFISPISAVLPVVAPLVHCDTASIPAVELALRASGCVGWFRPLSLRDGGAALLVGTVPAVVRAIALLLDLHAPAVSAWERVGLTLFWLALRLIVSVSTVVLAVALSVLSNTLAVAAVEGAEAALVGLAVLLISAVATVVDALAAVDQLPHALAVAAAEGPSLAVFHFTVGLVLLVLAVGPEIAAFLLGDASSIAAVEGPGGAGSLGQVSGREDRQEAQHSSGRDRHVARRRRQHQLD